MDGVLRGRARIAERVFRQHPGAVGNAAFGSQRFLAADRHAPQAAIDGVGRAIRRNRQVARLQIVELFLALERLVAHRRDDFELRRQRAHRHFEAHLVVARGRAAVRDGIRAELARHQRDGLRLHDALRAHAQWIELAAAHVAHDEEAQHLLEVVRARVDLVMLDGAVRLRTFLQRLRARGVDAARVHGDRDDGAAVVFLEPRHQERGVETAGIGEDDGFRYRQHSFLFRLQKLRATARARAPARAHRPWR